MNKKAFKVELKNDKPNGERSYYETLPLPATEYEIRDALHRIRSTNGTITPSQMSVYDCQILPLLCDARLDSPTLDELNFLAKRLVELDKNEIAVLKAVAPKIISTEDGDPISIKDLINITYGLESVSVISNIRNDIELAEFVVETGMQSDVASVPDNATYLLDRSRIGRLQREMDGGVFVDNLYVCTDHFEMPKVYDGITLPETPPEQWFAFRLLVSEEPKDGEPTIDSAEWITLPLEAEEMKRIAARHNEATLGDCVYYDFESSIPQITSEDFVTMHDIDMLNDLAKRMAEMSPEEQITFKAALEASREHGINFDDIFNIAHNLHKFEMAPLCDSADSFFKEYLLTHMDTKFDENNLKSLMASGFSAFLFLSKKMPKPLDFESCLRIMLFEKCRKENAHGNSETHQPNHKTRSPKNPCSCILPSVLLFCGSIKLLRKTNRCLYQIG